LNPRIPISRAIVSSALLVFVVVGPLGRGLGVFDTEWFIRWHMFMSFGYDICEVSFFERVAGQDHRIDRYELLDLGPWWQVPIAQRQMRTRSDIEDAVGPICAALGPHADVRVSSRCGTAMQGWKERATRRINACQ